MLDIEKVEELISGLIANPENGLGEEHLDIVKELYLKFREIIVTTIEEQNITSLADLGAPFWFQFLKSIMESVENYQILGEHKKEIVIELICLVIMHEVELGDDIKSEIVKQIRNYAPSAIDLIVNVSRHIDINVQVDSKSIAKIIANKLCCCILGTK